MHLSGWLIAMMIGAAVVVVMVARWMSKRSVLGGRKPIGLEEMHRQYAARADVSYELFERVFNTVGQAYRIDPELLRPSDKLKKLYDLDSWELGEGTETLNERLEKDFGITHFEGEPQTIAELVVEIEKQSKH
jgi:hypothetical protein